MVRRASNGRLFGGREHGRIGSPRKLGAIGKVANGDPVNRLLQIPIIGLLLLAAGCYSADGEQNGVDTEPGAKLFVECGAVPQGDDLADQLLQLANLERAAAGLPPVVSNDRLMKAADGFACRMIEESFFDHYDPGTGHGPGDRAVASKYVFYSIGENLAAGQETAADVINLWMDSPTHRDILLDPDWKDTGIAVRAGSEDLLYWVMEFGDPVEFPIGGVD